MGGKLGTTFARAGHEVVFSYSRSEQKLKMLARETKGKAKHGTPREAVQDADAVLLAVHWSRIDEEEKIAVVPWAPLAGGKLVRWEEPTARWKIDEFTKISMPQQPSWIEK